MVRMWSLVTFLIGVVILLPFSYEATQHENVAKNCRDLQCRGNNETGIYLIKPEFTLRPFLVYCDMDTEGGGWAVFFNRADDRQSFALPWNDYKYGFGNDSSFWLGLEYLHQLTTDEPNELFMKAIGEDGKTYYAQYDSFSIGSEGEDYRLKLLDGYHGHHADPFSNSSGQKFSTFDRNNEVRDDKNSCVKLNGRGGWWYFDCYSLVLTSRSRFDDSRLMLWTIESNPGGRWVRSYLEKAKVMVRPKKKCEKNLQEDNTDKEYDKNNTVKNDPEKGHLKENTKSTENSIVPITLPSVADSLQWLGYVLKTNRFIKGVGIKIECPAALLKPSWVLTSQNCEDPNGTIEFELGESKIKKLGYKGDDHFLNFNNMSLYETRESFHPGPSDTKIGPGNDEFIRFYGVDPDKKQFKLNNSINCTKNAQHKESSCLVVTKDKPFTGLATDIMVGSNGQLIGIYEDKHCEATFCEVYYADTTSHKTYINKLMKEEFIIMMNGEIVLL